MDAITLDTPRIDWQVERSRIDLAAVATRLLGPATRKKHGRLWWRCPFHAEESPSFFVKVKAAWWGCYGCSEQGDAAALVMKLERLTFPEAIAWLVGDSPSSRKHAPPQGETDSRSALSPPPSSLPDEALAIVEAAEHALWTDEGAEALAYLRARGPDDGTIRAARLGFIRVRRTGIPCGISIPWFDGPRLSMVNVRRQAGSDPKYMLFTGSRRGGVYPGPPTARAGMPLIVVEGELDCLLLGQELSGLASVVTLGGAASRPDPAILAKMLAASPWYVATDGDRAGDLAAAGWPAHARRIRPPAPYKDWSDASADGLHLRRWWTDALAGTGQPALFTWDELKEWRWGDPSDDAPGIVIDEPAGAPTLDAHPDVRRRAS